MSELQKHFALRDLFPLYYPGIPADVKLYLNKPAQHEISGSEESPAIEQEVVKVGYRPFDIRYCRVTELQATIGNQTGTNIIGRNIFLNVPKSGQDSQPAHAFLSRYPTTTAFLSESLQTYMFPLYRIDDRNSFSRQSPKLNLNDAVLNQFARRMGLSFLAAHDERGNVCMASDPDVRPEYRITFSINDILQYVYAELYSSNMSLSTDRGFPLIPYPANSEVFWTKALLGSELIKLHLMAATPETGALPSFPATGNNIIKHPVSSTSFAMETPDSGTIRINGSSFATIPLKAWEMTVGDYNPARQWLSDRLSHVLTPKDIAYYKKLIRVLSEHSSLITQFK